MTSKRQVTIPKAVATRFGIEPGDEIEFEAAGEVIRVIPPAARRSKLGLEERLRLFDAATERQCRRNEERRSGGTRAEPTDRGWTREELYTRGPD